MTAGYSNTPLLKKLGIKPGAAVLPVYAPVLYTELVGPLPEGARLVTPGYTEPVDFIHFFAPNASVLNEELPGMKQKLSKNGMLWVSWIKKSSSLETDISESDVRGLGLKTGLVDIKICAVDNDWSGLKFVYRKENR